MSDPQTALLKEALDHLNRNDAVQAERVLARVLDAEPEQADALQLMGHVRRMQGNFDEAEALLRRSIAADPGRPLVHHHLGSLCRERGKLDEAIAEQEEAIRLKGNYADAWFELGLTQIAKGDPAAAEKSLRRALHIVPNFLFARQVLAIALNDMGRAREAEALLRQTLSLGPRDPRQVATLEHNLGVALKLQGRYDEALQFFDHAQQRVSNVPLADFNRGHTLQMMGRLEEAEASYRRALDMDPQNEKAARNLAEVLEQRGNA
jgi:protein O-GlcNAc transferase